MIKKLTILILLIFTITLLIGTVSATNAYNTTLVSNSSSSSGGNHESTVPSMSADGNLIVYSSTSTNLIPNKVTTYYENIFLYNKSSGKTSLVTKGRNGNGGNRDSYSPCISGDGTIVAFASCASDLMPGRVINNTANIYTYNITSGITELVTEGPGGAGVNGNCGHPSVNYDGTVITYESLATNIDTNKKSKDYDIFVYDSISGENKLISIKDSGMGSNDCTSPIISFNGNLITYFVSYGKIGENLTTYGNIALYNNKNNETYLVSYGAMQNGGNKPSDYPRISAFGNVIVFASFATDMIYGTLTNTNENIFIYDIYADSFTLISKGASGNGGNGYSSRPSINADGTIITFYSTATDLIPGLTTNGKENIFVYDVFTGKMGLMSPGNGGKGGNAGSFNPVISYDGTTIVYQSSASNLIKGKNIIGEQIYFTNVNNKPIAINDTVTLAEDTNVTIPVLNNDTDQNGDNLTIYSISGPLHGTVTVNPDKTILYKAYLNYNGLDSFSYTITDGKNGFSTATVNINITPVNDAPVAVNDAKMTPGNTSVVIPVLLNDSDVDNDNLSITGTSNPLHGTITVNPDKTITYTPNTGFIGSDSFTYTINDGHGETSTATVTITVNNPPVAVNDVFNTRNTVSTAIDVTNNDMDPDGDNLTVSIFSNPLHGKVAVNGKIITYIANAGYFGSDSFKYIISDGHGGTSTATVSGTVIDVAPPVVVLTYPKNAAKSVSRTSTIYIKFSENIKSSINWSKVVVKNSRRQKVSIKKWISGNTLYIKQTYKRTKYSYYTVYIPSSAVKDYAGHRLAAKYTFKFKTGG
ncbi:MAG: Ig-like domain-containing protein [Methanobacteriaceae archaeon]|nr:Ig-like domain-containing protein [Methanobacteriaceae archaeon]MDP3034854.1 Ig-like domain-containing protein [Methanobacteriaceae archaeon]MDP3624782.1 Ig-like domain-containing protein [Methanobacteriaceae archaeon]